MSPEVTVGSRGHPWARVGPRGTCEPSRPPRTPAPGSPGGSPPPAAPVGPLIPATRRCRLLAADRARGGGSGEARPAAPPPPRRATRRPCHTPPRRPLTRGAAASRAFVQRDRSGRTGRAPVVPTRPPTPSPTRLLVPALPFFVPLLPRPDPPRHRASLPSFPSLFALPPRGPSRRHSPLPPGPSRPPARPPARPPTNGSLCYCRCTWGRPACRVFVGCHPPPRRVSPAQPAPYPLPPGTPRIGCGGAWLLPLCLPWAVAHTLPPPCHRRAGAFPDPPSSSSRESGRGSCPATSPPPGLPTRPHLTDESFRGVGGPTARAPSAPFRPRLSHSPSLLLSLPRHAVVTVFPAVSTARFPCALPGGCAHPHPPGAPACARILRGDCCLLFLVSAARPQSAP